MGRRGNPNWGKPEPLGPVVPSVSSFEGAVKELKLQPDQYVHSQRLREWAWRNKDSKFIPESLLKAWGFDSDQRHPVVPVENEEMNKFVAVAAGRRGKGVRTRGSGRK